LDELLLIFNIGISFDIYWCLMIDYTLFIFKL